ncbi:hypothetical protein EXW28_10705 [Bacillus mycoides]|nr:hypothetical protein EXW37_10705 [Bacillus mycoides]QWG55869.1 hypothetical protein EXW26_10780 [Bacillus mycoides]QWH34113.1 hypothetical protein EXW28_10705 [Bacillus mycoides]
MNTFTSVFTKKFMILLISRVRHYLTITLRNPADNRGFFYLNSFLVKKPFTLKLDKHILLYGDPPSIVIYLSKSILISALFSFATK